MPSFPRTREASDFALASQRKSVGPRLRGDDGLLTWVNWVEPAQREPMVGIRTQHGSSSSMVVHPCLKVPSFSSSNHAKLGQNSEVVMSCSVCQKFSPSGAGSIRIAVDDERWMELYRCSACGSYWEAGVLDWHARELAQEEASRWLQRQSGDHR